MKRIAFLLLAVTIPLVAAAQNDPTFNYTPMYSSYENESFFYQPSEMTPAYPGTFNQLEPGFTRNPLNQLAQNPAWTPDLNGHDLYAYANVQSRNMYKADNNPQYYNPCPYCLYMPPPINNNIISGPDIYNPYVNADGNRLNQEPFLSAAVIGYPFADKRIFAGITYQGIYSTEDYYAYPSMSYPQNYSVGYLSTASVNPIEYFRGGNLKQTGHFISFYSAYQLTEKTSLGIKIGVALFKRDGGYGNTTYNSNPIGYFYELSTLSVTPSDLFTEQRNQHYRHLDIDAGGRYIFNTRWTGMVHLGYLIGSGDENLNSIVPSISHMYYGGGLPIPVNTSYSHQQVSNYFDSWNNNGHTFYGGLSVLYKPSANMQFRFFYEGSGNGTALNPNSRSDSYSYTMNKQPPGGNQAFATTTQSTSLHSGTGRKRVWTHQFGLFYEWSPLKLLTVNTGIQFENYKDHIYSHEVTVISGTEIVNRTDSTGQVTTVTTPLSNVKSIDWRHTYNQYNFQIPLIIRLRLMNRFEIWGGFDESLEKYKTMDNIFASTYPESRYRFTLLSGVDYQLNGQITFHLMALPLDHRYSYDHTLQTSGLIWQAGVSIYP